MSFVHNINPTIIDFGPVEIRYYGLVYVIGVLVVLGYLLYQQKKGQLELSKNEVWDLVFWLTVGLVVGARLFEVLIWEPGYFLSHPREIIMIWKGGMSFHGGLAGIILAGYLFARKKKINFWKLADLVAIPAILAAGLGRIANFINGELWGTVSNLPWCVYFKGAEGCRHPYQIYAALQRFLVGGILLWVNRKESKPGFIFWNLILLEGAGRILVDLVRDEAKYLFLSQGQWLSVVMVIMAGFVLVKKYKEDLKNLLNFS